MNQKHMFLESEGDRWFDRNRDDMVKASDADPVTVAINQHNIKPTSVVEVGCANGWRLALLRGMFGCEVLGVDPSMMAARDAATRRVRVLWATASTMSIPLDLKIDLVIYGFCLYLTDPADWLQIAAKGDDLLAPGGHLIVHDFYGRSTATARRYEHRAGILCYHFDFAALWLAHPLYILVGRTIIGDQMVTVLKKLDASSIPVRP